MTLFSEPDFDRCEVVAFNCSDGFLNPSEECDDSNSADNDGCSSLCVIEDGWTCSPSCSETCGDGLMVGQETCDAGTLEGCTQDC